MDAGGLYLRVFLGGRSFKSSELDSLAKSMGVSDRMSRDSKERYFMTKAKVPAFTFGNKLLFGAGYYQTLTESQRLAVAAHEFGHVLGDSGEVRKRLVAPAAAVSVLLGVLVSLAMGSLAALTIVSVSGFIAAVAILSSIDSDHYLRHEMSCDKLAASFADGEALVEAIHVAESLQRAGTNKMVSWRRVGTSPSTKLRIDAILAMKSA